MSIIYTASNEVRRLLATSEWNEWNEKKWKDIDEPDPYGECESVSLRHEVFLRIGSEKRYASQKDFEKKKTTNYSSRYPEVEALVQCSKRQSFSIPPFAPKGAVSFTAKLGGRLIVNQAGGVLENAGLCLHPHFNAPYIPGSAVKGCARHAAWLEWNAMEEGRPKDNLAEEIAAIFGYPTGDKAGLDKALERLYRMRIGKPKAVRPANSGCVGFMPACPEKQAKLVADVLTPHGGNDWTEPVPSAFPAVEQGAEFRFSVVPCSAESKIERAVAFLKRGLVDSGVGAKTNAGYGRFEIADVLVKSDLEIKLHFASPAFLRGASDEGALRVSTLRGMLRWWWRWVFRSVLPEQDVKKLESVVWGGCDEKVKSSCISLALSCKNPGRAVPFIKQQKTPRHNFRQLRTSGLAYLAYGMDEKTVRRQVLEVNRQLEWVLRVAVNSRKSGMSKESLLAHLKLAVWALSSYGGVGAKARKGFGSLCSTVSYPDLNAVYSDVGIALVNSGFELSSDELSQAYALDSSELEEVQTRCKNPWIVLDRIGYALQCVASSYKHKEVKAVLGLPRKIHGPEWKPMGHQIHFHEPPKSLEADSRLIENRFAMPLSIHLEDTPNGLRVNLAAFPSALVRDYETSSAMLSKCIKHIKDELSKL